MEYVSKTPGKPVITYFTGAACMAHQGILLPHQQVWQKTLRHIKSSRISFVDSMLSIKNTVLQALHKQK
jgi:hypothetical protein